MISTRQSDNAYVKHYESCRYKFCWIYAAEIKRIDFISEGADYYEREKVGCQEQMEKCCSTERMAIMDRLDAEVQYRIAKWVFTNMMINGEITVEEYTEIHKKLIEKFDPPMKSVETPGFYLQEVMDDE